jgi:hypothetical protein
METFVAPLTLEDLPESFHPTLKAVRSSAGEALVLDENMFIEKMLPGVTQRALSADEMAEYQLMKCSKLSGPEIGMSHTVKLNLKDRSTSARSICREKVAVTGSDRS